jgi:hypothetical protein
MSGDTVIHYVPKTVTTNEIKTIRDQYKNSDTKVIIMVSGNENLMDNLKEFIKARKI